MSQSKQPINARYIGQTFTYFGCLCLIGLVFFLGGLACWLISISSPPKQAVIQSRRLTCFVFHCYLRWCHFLGLMALDLSALDCLNQSQGLIIAPNHPSMIDVVLIMSRIKNCTCIAKQTLIQHPVLGLSARANDYISNADLPLMIKRSIEALDSGAHVLVFPESTRTRLHHQLAVNPLGGSAALIAKRAKKPIQMVYIHTNSHFLGGQWRLFDRPQFPIVYRVVLGEQLAPLADLSEAIAQMQTAYQDNLKPVH